MLATANSFPLFLHDETGARRSLTRGDIGKYRTKEDANEYTAAELAALALASPERFSPNVTLRAVVQDYLLPTIAYYGGAAEITGREKNVDALLAFAAERAPWAVLGYSEDLNKLFKQKTQEFCGAVEQRKRELASQAQR